MLLNVLLPKRSMSYSPEHVNVTLYGKKEKSEIEGICGYFMDLEIVALTWIIAMRTKCSYKVLYERKVEGNLTHPEIAIFRQQRI